MALVPYSSAAQELMLRHMEEYPLSPALEVMVGFDG